MRRRELLVLIGISGLVCGGGCSLITPHWIYRYRLTVEVEQGGRQRTGSSVIEVRRDKGITGIGGTARGEAVVVDLGKSGLLFALLSGKRGGSDWSFTMPHYAFSSQLGTTSMVAEPALDKITELKGARAVLSVDDYPMLVRFRDIQDPTSVEQVDENDLATSFGPGVTLRRITIQITDDPVTTGIEAWLPWLPGLHGSYLHGGTTSRGAPLGLYGGNFSTELFK